MKLLYRCCAGLDVHKKSISVCVRARVSGSQEVEIHEAAFGTFTRDLERPREWLKEHKVKQVAMESTGVYWVPVWNMLEPVDWGLELMLVNPQMVVGAARVQRCAGRKADERPVLFQLAERVYTVEEIVDQWYGPNEAFFKVRADDGNFYILRHNNTPDEWRLESSGAKHRSSPPDAFG